jgi:hypothetical protein
LKECSLVAIEIEREADELIGARRDEMASLRGGDVEFNSKSIWAKDKVREEVREVPGHTEQPDPWVGEN